MMKKYFKVAFSCLAAVSMTAFVGCSSEDNPITVGQGVHPEREIIDVHGKIYDVTGAITTGAVDAVGMAYATISGQVDLTVMSAVYERYVAGVQVAKDEKFTSGCKEFEVAPNAEDGSFSIDCSGLAANQQYYYRAFTKIVDKYVYGSASTFTTNDLTQNIVTASGSFTNASVLYTHACNADKSKITVDPVGGSCYVGMIYIQATNVTNAKNALTEDNIISNIKSQWALIKDSSLTQTAQTETMLIKMKPIEEVAANGDFTLYTYALHPGNLWYYYLPFTCIVSEDDKGNVDVTVKTEMISSYVTNSHRQRSYSFDESGLIDLCIGTKWNYCNLGGDIEEAGTLFYWGEGGTEPYSATTLITLNDISGDSRYDAATKSNASLRMPTSDDMKDLIEQCTWIRAEYKNRTSGYIVIGKNGNSIFMPMTVGGNVTDYWTSTGVDNGSYMQAYSLLTFFNSPMAASRMISGNTGRSGNRIHIRPVDMASKQ